MIRAVKELLFPSICFSCRSDMEENVFLCDLCRVGFDLSSSRLKCKRCFREKESGVVCSYCIKKAPWWESRGTVFPEDGAHNFLLCDQDRFGKELAMLALIQVIRFGWPMNTKVYALSKEVKHQYSLLTKTSSFSCETELYIGILPSFKEIVDKRVYLLYWTECELKEKLL